MARGKTSLVSLAVAFCSLCAAASRGDGTLTDDETKEKIVAFVTLPSRLCGQATLDFRNELAARRLTNRDWFDGDTNRLARLICELAQTNNIKIAGMMIGELGEYGTPAQLPFLYSCATNPVVGDRAVKSILRIEGVTSNSVAAVHDYLSITNLPSGKTQERDDVCIQLVNAAWDASVPAPMRDHALNVAYAFAANINQCHQWLDAAFMRHDGSYQYSRRRLSIFRAAVSRGLNQYSQAYVTNAINELVAYPEANLPE